MCVRYLKKILYEETFSSFDFFVNSSTGLCFDSFGNGCRFGNVLKICVRNEILGNCSTALWSTNCVVVFPSSVISFCWEIVRILRKRLQIV